MSKLLVIAESKEGTLSNVSFEAIAATKMIHTDAEVVGVVLGKDNLEGQAQELIYHGADRVIMVAHDNLEAYTSEGCGQAVLSIVNDESPDGIVMGHISIGKDLNPQLAAKLETDLVSDVISIEQKDGRVEFIRPIYSGKAFERKFITDELTFATIRPNNIAMLMRDESRSGEFTAKDVEITDIRTIMEEVVRKTSEGVNLSETNIVIAGGHGVKNKEGFDELYKLADVLDAAVGWGI